MGVMDRFTRADVPRYAVTKEGFSGEMFSSAPGTVYGLAADAKQWPEPLKTFIAHGEIMAGLAERPTWARTVVEIDPSTFRSTVPPPAPPPVLWTRDDITANLRLSEAAFEAALTLGFPASQMRRLTTRPDGSVSSEPLWRAEAVTAWHAKQQQMVAGRG